jgi:hypothetical protein
LYLHSRDECFVKKEHLRWGEWHKISCEAARLEQAHETPRQGIRHLRCYDKQKEQGKGQGSRDPKTAAVIPYLAKTPLLLFENMPLLTIQEKTSKRFFPLTGSKDTVS